MNNIIDELKWRDMLKDVSNQEKIITSHKDKSGVYCGFDPTSDSLHIGNLIQLLVLKRFHKFGYTPVPVIGQATAAIGDPSGKKSERALQSLDVIENNISNIKKQIKKILPDSLILNNNDWLKDITIIDFLHNIGKSFNVSYLINKEHIKSRLETGISYTEFTYTLLQSYDFLHLYNNNNVKIQIGGSDQWGNIVSGIDYIKNNVKDSLASGLTIKLLLKPDGNKFGKTETGTIWLDRHKTNPYDFYQFFLNQDDKTSETLLKYFTLLNKNEIENIVNIHNENSKSRHIQKTLASYLTKMVHSEKDLLNINKVNDLLFKDKINDISESIINELLINIIPVTQINDTEINIIELLVNSKICSSKREAREFVNNNAIKINQQSVNDTEYIIKKSDLLFKKYIIFKKGKKKHFLIKKV